LFLLITVAFRLHESCNFNIGQFCREDLHPRTSIINLCQLSVYVPYRVISRKRISYYFSNQAELKIFNARRSKCPAGSTQLLFYRIIIAEPFNTISDTSACFIGDR
jgi:hypothetical protein